MASYKQFKGLADGTVEFTNISSIGTFRTCYIESIRFYSDEAMTNRIYPTDGTIRAQFRAGNDGDWRPFTQAPITDLVYGNDWPPKAAGVPIRGVRLIFDGLPVGTYFDAQYYLSRDADSALDPRIQSGSQPLTVQGFNESNSKRGVQYETSLLFTNITQAAPVYIGFETGDLPVIIKQRDIYGNFVGGEFDVYKDSTYSGGTIIPIFNNNDLTPNPALSEVTQDPTVTDEGDQFGATTYLIGSEGSGNRNISTFGDAAGEKILAPNTKYVGKITNTETAAIDDVAIRLYFYEGPLSTNI